MSIKKVDDGRLDDLFLDLNKIGVHAKKTRAIEVPWFPKEMDDINLLG
jgi:hypothetical protein